MVKIPKQMRKIRQALKDENAWGLPLKDAAIKIWPKFPSYKSPHSMSSSISKAKQYRGDMPEMKEKADVRTEAIRLLKLMLRLLEES